MLEIFLLQLTEETSANSSIFHDKLNLTMLTAVPSSSRDSENSAAAQLWKDVLQEQPASHQLNVLPAAVTVVPQTALRQLSFLTEM